MINSDKFFNEKNFNIFKNSLSSSNLLKDKNRENQSLKSFLNLYDENVSEYFDRLDNYNGFFSTQQIEDVDFSKFEEHVFFDSALEKTNDAFKNIFNNFPYDGNYNEVINYLNSIDGYSRYILKEKHYKNIGYLRFDKSYYLKIIDRNGWLLNDFKEQIGKGILNVSKSFNYSFDFWLYGFKNLNRANGESQIICQKSGNTEGYTLFLDRFDDTELTCYLNAFIKKDNEEIYNSIKISIDKWQHINISCQVSNNNTSLVFYVNGIKKSSILNNRFIFFSDDFDNQDFLLGNGVFQTSNNSEVSITNSNKEYTFEGLLDEFRIFSGENRDRETISEEKNENIYSRSSLKICLRFNEPEGVYQNNNIILDYSGNKLHAVMYDMSHSPLNTNSTSAFRGIYNNIITPLKYEVAELNPVLFSSHPNFNEIQKPIFEEAKRYDLANPNSFWKLMPKNLFLEGSDFDNVPDVYINEPINEIDSRFGNLKSSINHKMVNLFSIWARFFDQLKMYIDSITKIIEIDYEKLNDNKKINGIILPTALKMSGFNFREILPYPVLEKLQGKNLTHEEVISNMTIRQIQNTLWQRFLINSKDYMMSKGTISSINSVFNSFGLSSREFLSIKEFNGQNKFNISNNHSKEKIVHKQIDFACDDELFNITSSQTSNNKSVSNRILFKTPEFTNSYLDMDGNWAIEVLINFDKTKLQAYSLKQSLLRVDNNKDNQGNYERPHINVVFERKNKNLESGTLKAFINDLNNHEVILIATLENVNLLNGEIHHICLQRKITEFENETLNYSEYILSKGSIGENFYSNPVMISSVKNLHFLSYKDNVTTQINIGNYSLYESENDRYENLDYTTDFQGKISNFRIYNTYFNEQQLFDKCKAINNISIKKHMTDRFTDKNELDYVLLNIDLYQDTNAIQKNQNNIYEIKSLIDKNHSETVYNKAFICVGDTIASNNFFPIKTKKIEILQNNYDFDFPKSNNFIYINSFSQEEFKKQYKNYNVENLPRTEPDFVYSKDNRLSIDFSLVQSLNKDINKIININEKFTEKLTQVANLYEDSYQDLNALQNKYFERLEAQLDIPRIYQLYKYFDNILEELLYECIPTKTNYKGFNFVYESHALERNKYQYKMINSLLPVIQEEYKHSYYKDLSQSKNHRISENLNFSYVSKNKR